MLDAIDLKAAKFALEKMAESMKRYSILEDYKALYDKVVPPVAKIQDQIMMFMMEHQQWKEILST